MRRTHPPRAGDDPRTPSGRAGAASGARLRARRLALGQSLEQVSAATKIPVPHLEALEDDRLHDLPAGPYAAAYARTLVGHLGLEGASSEGGDPPRAVGATHAGAPLWLVRFMAVVSLLALVAVVGSAAWERLRPVGRPPVGASGPDQTLVIEARRSTTVTVSVDGAPSEQRTVAGGERLELAARDRVEVAVASIADVHIEWNGETVVPQGRQDSPRKLVFVDDE